jgi:hypothetical protein
MKSHTQRFGFTAMIEKRVAPRHRVFKQGAITFRGGGGSIECTVRNLSSSGARVDIASPVGLPPSFTLVIAADRFMRNCHTVWSNDQRVGLAFD